jgi:hypothetical protein
MTKIDQLEAQVRETFALGHERAYVEAGIYKFYMPNTILALQKRGYKVESPKVGVYYVYPKGA